MSIYITRALGVGSTLGILLMVYMGKGIKKIGYSLVSWLMK